MTFILLSLLIGVIVVFWIAPRLPVSFGWRLYKKEIELEAKISGMQLQAVDIGEMPLQLFTNQKIGKPVLILLHGYSADKSVWLRFARYLTSDFHLIIPDLAGHGDSPYDPNWNYSASSQAQRIIALMDKLAITKAHIAGNSMGGLICALLARDYPQRVLTTCLIDPAGVSSAQLSDMEKLLLTGRNPFEVNNREQFEQFFAMTMAKPPWLPKIVIAALAEDYQRRKPQLQKIFKDFFLHDRLDQHLGDIRCPVLLLWGEDDRLIHVSCVDVWRAGIPNISVTVWPEIGHMPMLETPEQCALRVSAFIQENNSALERQLRC